MLRKAKSPVKFKFTREGGSIIVSQVDIWKPTEEEDWVLIDQVKFSDATKEEETLQVKLKEDQYTCVFQCFVQESLNGRYKFVLAVDEKDTFGDEGDVNTTPSTDDSKVYKDQFVLAVGKTK